MAHRTAQHWRDRAALARESAERIREPELRRKMQKIAESYEQLAQREDASQMPADVAWGNTGLRHGEIVHYIASITGASMVSFQIAEQGRLKLRAAHGLNRRFIEFFDVVVVDEACACSAAFKSQLQIVTPDIGGSSIYAGRQPLEELRVAGVAACVSTPIVRYYDGAMLGIFSILKAKVWNPAPGELDQLSEVGRQVSIALSNPFSTQANMIRGVA